MSEDRLVQEINRSKTYILPLLEEFFNLKYIRFIKNTYIFTDNDTYEYCIHISYDISVMDKDDFIEYKEYCINHPLFLKFRETKTGILLSLRLPETHYNDFNNFIKGNYSLYQKHSKQKILVHLYENYPSRYEVIKRVEAVLYKEEKLKKAWEDLLNMTISKDQELSSRVEVEKETYRFSIKN